MDSSRASSFNPTLFLKANILVDRDRHARLADFGFLTVVSDPTHPITSSSYSAGGTIRWMSPELLFSDETGPKGSRPTKQSDCYALGMVVYEVLSGQAPFAPSGRFAVMRKIMDGEHPQRPRGVEGAWFTDDLWRMLNRCWATRPESRPSSSAVLECLERVSRDMAPPSGGVDEPFTVGWNNWNLTKSFSRVFSWFDLRCFVALLRRILC